MQSLNNRRFETHPKTDELTISFAAQTVTELNFSWTMMILNGCIKK